MQQVTIVAKLPALASLWALLLGILPFDEVSPFRTLVVVVTGRLVGLPLGRPPSVPLSLRPSRSLVHLDQNKAIGHREWFAGGSGSG